ncbi:MAG: OB-fold nucleic acid binding domain-containing protein, partial [Herbaspirillum sp.]
IQGGMIHPYLRRRQGLEPVTYPSPAIQQALARTLGVPIFQEQVMQIAMLAGGFTPGEADQLRRAMAAWKRKGQLGQFQDKLTDGMRANGYSEEFTQQICQQVQGFAEYGFPESHAASFALLAYASSWLKCHEPEAFLVALLNSQPMGFYAPSQLVQDARRHGVVVLSVDVQASTWEAALETTESGRLKVRLGLNLVSGLTPDVGFRIEEARAIQSFADIHDLALRAQLNRLELEKLADANALVSLAGNRRQALWQAVAATPDKGLLQQAVIADDAVQLSPPSEADDIVGDYRSLGLTLGRHPLALLRPVLNKMRFLPAEVLNTFADRQLARGCGIVTVRQRPQTAKGVIFLSMEDETGAINVIVWPDLVERQRKELLNASLLGVYGVWQSERGVHNLIAKRLVDLSHLLGALGTSSRDFC